MLHEGRFDRAFWLALRQVMGSSHGYWSFLCLFYEVDVWSDLVWDVVFWV